MRLLMYLSNIMVPMILFYVIGYAILLKRPIFEDFLDGAKEGLRTVIGILPTLIGLITAVGILRSSGLLEVVAEFMSIFAEFLNIPEDVIPVILVRTISNSAAVGLMLDLFKKYGPDSYVGMLLSIMMGCTETIFYTMSLYYMNVNVSKTRWTIPGAIAATIAGISASIFLAGCINLQHL